MYNHIRHFPHNDDWGDITVKRIVHILAILLFITFLTRGAFSTTEAVVKEKCPLCEEDNKFLTAMSGGSYIFDWPEKYQLIFWPHTTGWYLWSCRKCHLTLFIDDFKSFPKERAREVKKALKDISPDGKYTDYTDIPMSKRLEMGKKIYALLQKDDHFWCQYYRIIGYHLEREGARKEAAEARRKALEISEKMMREPGNIYIEKELLTISGAMHYYLNEYDHALRCFNQARTLKYRDREKEKDSADQYDMFLSKLLNDYIKKIEEEKKQSHSKEVRHV